MDDAESKGFLVKSIVKADLVPVCKEILPLPEVPITEEEFLLLPTLEELPAIALKHLERLPELIAKLENEEQTIWPRLGQAMILRELRQFSQRLKEWAEEYQSPLLLNYVKQLELQLQAFDSENLAHTVKAFPEICTLLKNQYLILKDSFSDI